jgi:hypothetical protein
MDTFEMFETKRFILEHTDIPVHFVSHETLKKIMREEYFKGSYYGVYYHRSDNLANLDIYLNVECYPHVSQRSAIITYYHERFHHLIDGWGYAKYFIYGEVEEQLAELWGKIVGILVFRRWKVKTQKPKV